MPSKLSYQDSRLWKNYLAVQSADDIYEPARGRLRLAFEKTRDSIAPLVAKIQHELPSLTMHDVSHLDALWHVADTIVGDQFDLNPAEVFVLGMSFLLHDAATSSFAYTGGIEAVRKTVAWKDYVAQRRIDESTLLPGSNEYQRVLFETLRVLHASHATNLLTQTWKDLNGETRYLLEDVELRNHYGAVIGQVAASHGEDPANVEIKWASIPPMSAHMSLALGPDANWTVDRLKVALLLRCSDAAHIDSLRAPDMQAILVSPEGESKNHWIFQNRLGSIAINNKSELYWSSPAFAKSDAAAWWRCYETCKMVDRELRISNRILLDNNRPLLKPVGVMGAHDPTVFQRNVPVDGWYPVDFNFQVSQVGSIIEKFGGESLYGTEPRWALRELIQNAADAVRARRIHSSKARHGRISVRLRQTGEDVWLDVEDDGIGMTRFVLTDVLLDFGRSLWNDAALREQWSGLSSKGFTSVGQFGIGFFSVFMLGDEVKVTTWPHGRGIEQQLTLHLRNRVVDRPLLLNTEEEDRLGDFGTRVSVRLKQGRESVLRKIDTYVKMKRIKVEEDFGELIAWLAPALDVDLYIKDEIEEEKLVVEADDWKSIPAAALLKRICPYLDNATILESAKRIANIVEADGTIVGRAAFTADRYTYRKTCSLVHKGMYAGECGGIIGIMQSTNNVDLARKTARPVASAIALTSWASSQIDGSSPQTIEKCADRAISLGYSSPELIVGRLDDEYVTINDLIEKLEKKEIREIVMLTEWPTCPSDISESDFEDLQIYDSVVNLTSCKPKTRYSFELPRWLEEILPDTVDAPKTIAGLIEMILKEKFSNLQAEMQDRVIGEIDYEDFETSCQVLYFDED